MKTIEITETVLRDAHQSLMATRMRREDFEVILTELDKVGYRALECWGGATFDSCIRFLNEDPWDRLRFIKSNLKNTKTQMLLRGQNLLGYKNYPDDVVEKFIELAIYNGIDIIRIFDALNDVRNLETSINATKKYGAEAQVSICYTVSEVHTIEYYKKLTEKITEMGADTIAIKDMAGILTPYRAYKLIESLKKSTNKKIELHTHETTGMGSMTYLKGIEAGVDIIDTALAPFSGGTSQPATEVLSILIEESGNKTRINMKVLEKVSEYFQTIKDKYLKDETMPVKMLSVDPKGLLYQVPGGMLSNLYSQLKGLNKLEKYSEVLKEVPKVRKDLGYPPLVTPMSQMVGTQAAFNIILGERYKMVPNEVKDYLKGLYGQAPVKIDEGFRKSIIGDVEPITDRPANHLENGLEKALNEVKDIARTREDVLTYALFGDTGKKFLENKYDF